MKLNFALIVFAAGLAVGQSAWADETSDEIQALKKQIQELDQKVRVLQRQRELDEELAAANSANVPRVVAGNNGLVVTSADSNFVFSLRGLLQVDNRSFFNNSGLPGNDTFLLRRARPIFQGTVFRDFDFLFVPDFAGSSVQIFDAYINYRYKPGFQLRAGKMKTPVGLEALQSDPVTAFNERALPTQLTPNRDIGFQLWGDLLDSRVNWTAGVFNGGADGRSTSNFDFDDHREFAGRIFLQPFRKSKVTGLRGLGFGVGGTWGKISPTNNAGVTSGYLTDAQQTFFTYTNGVSGDGEHWRLAPQAYYYHGPFGLIGEYTISDQRVINNTTGVEADVRNTGWQVTGCWNLTGEDASYTGLTPRKSFNPAAHQWGAFQLVARYGELKLDQDAFLFANPAASASKAQAWSVGLNWYLNRNLRVNASYARTTFEGGGVGITAPGVVTSQPEEVFFTRLQLSF